MAFHDVGVVHVTENLDFPVDLAADGLFWVAVDHFQGVDFGGGAVPDFVDCAAASASYSVQSFEVGEIYGGGGGGGGGGGWWWREGEGDS